MSNSNVSTMWQIRTRSGKVAFFEFGFTIVSVRGGVWNEDHRKDFLEDDLDPNI